VGKSPGLGNYILVGYFCPPYVSFLSGGQMTWIGQLHSGRIVCPPYVSTFLSGGQMTWIGQLHSGRIFLPTLRFYVFVRWANHRDWAITFWSDSLPTLRFCPVGKSPGLGNYILVG
jgi:hypothetical protein